MPTLRPQIALTVTLLDYSGAEVGTSATPAFVRVALAGFGDVLPCIPGTAMIGKAVSWPGDIPYTGAPLTLDLWGNDVISPAGTFYSISILDVNKNVLQSAAYYFSGTVDADLSEMTPIPPGGAVRLTGAVPNGAFPGSGYMLPSLAVGGAADAPVYYNGQLQLPSELGTYRLNGRNLALFFTTGTGDSLWVQYATAGAAGSGPMLVPWMSVANGVTPGQAFTIPTPPPGAQLAGVFVNGYFTRPSYYAINGGNLVFTYGLDLGDLIQLLYLIGPTPTLAGGTPTGAVPGSVFTLVGTLAAGLWLNGLFLRPEIDYTMTGSTIVINFALSAGDILYAI